MEPVTFMSLKNKPSNSQINEEEIEETSGSEFNEYYEDDEKEMNFIEIDIPPMKDELQSYDDDEIAESEYDFEGDDGEVLYDDNGEVVNLEDMIYESSYESDNEDAYQEEMKNNCRKYVEINIPSIKPTNRSTNNIKIIENKKMHPCKYCLEKFPSIVSLKTHLGSHGNYQCKVCEKRFMKPHYLRAHMTSHNEDRPFKCNKCNESFNHAISLRAHKVVHIEAKILQCDKCDRKFNRVTRLHAHRLKHGVERTFVCNICQKVYKTLSDYRTHKLVHLHDRRFECDMCDKKFKRKAILDSHKLCHSGEKPFKCEICPKQYTVLCNLRRHRLTHMSEKPCDECGKTFTTLSDLKRHKYEHLGYNPFECNVCHKIFTQSCDLRKHEIIHSGIKPYECSVCWRKFSSSSNMHKHKKTLHPQEYEEEKQQKHTFINEAEQSSEIAVSEIGFEAELPSVSNSENASVEDDTFETYSNVIKSRETPHQCDVCQKYFVSSSNLKRHKKVIHFYLFKNNFTTKC